MANQANILVNDIARAIYLVDPSGNPLGSTNPTITQPYSGGSPFGTVSNPVATNQLVGTPAYATVALSAAAGGNASLAGVTSKTTYINGFYVSVAHTSSGVSAGQVTLSLDGGTTTHGNFTIAVSTTFPGLVEVNFQDPVPATAANTAIKVTVPSLTNAGVGSIFLVGYQL